MKVICELQKSNLRPIPTEPNKTTVSLGRRPCFTSTRGSCMGGDMYCGGTNIGGLCNGRGCCIAVFGGRNISKEWSCMNGFILGHFRKEYHHTAIVFACLARRYSSSFRLLTYSRNQNNFLVKDGQSTSTGQNEKCFSFESISFQTQQSAYGV